ncbi:hypothetical protein [Streptomyces mirabilis]|uniref:hypothetical protein n=1 Tax=Streptomyces mirabilis TaxID=68239 RepID=UPI0033302D08
MAAAVTEDEFFALLEAPEVKVRRPKTEASGDVTGYSVCLPGDVNKQQEPIWYVGSTLAATIPEPVTVRPGNPWHQADAAIARIPNISPTATMPWSKGSWPHPAEHSTCSRSPSRPRRGPNSDEPPSPSSARHPLRTSADHAVRRSIREILQAPDGGTRAHTGRIGCRTNAVPAGITGEPGDASARTVHNLLNGISRRPIGRTCAAPERVFGCRVEDLGFSAPRTTHRRTRGGHVKWEKAAIKAHDSVLELQRRNAGERLRRALYALVAEYGPAETRVWVSLSMRAYRRQNGPEALVAAQAAQASSAARRDRSSTRRGESVPPSPTQLSVTAAPLVASGGASAVLPGWALTWGLRAAGGIFGPRPPPRSEALAVCVVQELEPGVLRLSRPARVPARDEGQQRAAARSL